MREVCKLFCKAEGILSCGNIFRGVYRREIFFIVSLSIALNCLGLHILNITSKTDAEQINPILLTLLSWPGVCAQWGYLHDPYVPSVFLISCFGDWGNSYRKISGDTCSGGDVEARLEGELVPCPLAGKTGSLFPLPS